MLTLPDGRVLEGEVVGPNGAPLVVSLHGTPAGHDLHPAVVASALRLGLRVASFARPGYAGSTRLPERDVAAVVPDVLAVADALAAERFAVVGTSGGGPHALACGALSDRCAAVATVAGVGAFGAPDLDFLAGMGEGNEQEFAAAVEGEVALRALIDPWRTDILDAGAQGIGESLESVLSPADRAVVTGEFAEQLHASMSLALREGVDGWVDDDLAFVRPWGFALADVRAPVTVWQGDDDLMVPARHARWLAAGLPTAELRLEAGEGHLSLQLARTDDVLAGLAERLGA